VGGGFIFNETFFNPIAAPALVIVASMMVKNVCNIKWNDVTECIPAFLTIIGIPLFYSISDGIAIGLVSYPFLKVFAGRAREVSWLMYILAVLVIAKYVLVAL
jgi:AGZA family xanthine/uracil permease-like MFS transporter